MFNTTPLEHVGQDEEGLAIFRESRQEPKGEPIPEETVAQAYNRKCRELMPNQGGLLVSEDLTTFAQIDETVFRRSEYLGGMADVICAIVAKERAQ